MGRLISKLLFLGVFASLLAAAASEPPPVVVRNVVLVSIDSLRADHLPFYGYPRLTTPALVELAERRGALVFRRTTAVSPACHPSHVALLTGLYPHQIGVPYCGEDVVPAGFDPLAAVELEELESERPPALHRQEMSAIVNGLVIPEGTATLPGFLREHGLRTGGFVSIWTVHGRFGYRRLFEHFVDEMPEYYGPVGLKWLLKKRYESQLRQSGAAVVDSVLDYLQKLGKDERFFLFVQLSDVHAPYAPRTAPPFDETPDERERLWQTWRARYPEEIWPRALRHLRHKDGQMLFDVYDRGIRYVDGELGRLIAYLDAADLLDETAVVVVADHGDSFGQRPYLSGTQRDRLFFYHSAYVWEETQHVPLVVYLPGLPPGVEERGTNASFVDLAPTVLDVLGFEPRELGSGEPLTRLGDEPRTVFYLTFGRGRPGVMGKMRPDRPKLIGLRRGDVKFFADRDHFKNPEKGRCFLYDLAADPDEMENLCDAAHREEARRYRRALVEWYSKAVAWRER